MLKSYTIVAARFSDRSVHRMHVQLLADWPQTDPQSGSPLLPLVYETVFGVLGFPGYQLPRRLLGAAVDPDLCYQGRALEVDARALVDEDTRRLLLDRPEVAGQLRARELACT